MAVETEATRPASRRRRVSRREVLGVALAGGAGVAAIRLLGIGAPSAPSAAPTTGKTDWISPLGGESARVSQLLRRVAFGATPDELDQALSDGYAKTVQRLLETPPAVPPVLAGADQAAKGNAIRVQSLQKWWIDWMLATPTPFAEAMTLFWHGHFTSDYRKVGLQTPWIYWQNLTWRKHALGDLKSFLLAVTSDPAMLRYLDLGNSTGQNPNENYSRELMELFTMGPGNFTEDDVRAAAKALAGWREPQAGSAGTVGIFDPKRAFKGGPITFLGKTGRFDTEAVINAILAQPATATFIVQRLLARLAMNNPAPAYVNRLADGFRRSKYSLKQLLHDILTSAEFNAAPTYRSLVKSPVEFMVHALKAVKAPELSQLAVQGGGGMGQNLFDVPDVGGWPVNEAWISSNTVLSRVNFVTGLLNGLKSVPPSSQAPAQHLESVVSPATAQLLNGASDDRERWFIVLASPEFQLK